MLIEKKAFTQLSWVYSTGHAAKTAELADIEGIIVRMDFIISSVTGNPTTNFTITDENSVVIVTLNTLADGTKHLKLATSDSEDFNALPVNNTTLTLSADPSADAGGTDTLTIDVILYIRKK